MVLGIIFLVIVVIFFLFYYLRRFLLWRKRKRSRKHAREWREILEVHYRLKDEEKKKLELERKYWENFEFIYYSRKRQIALAKRFIRLREFVLYLGALESKYKKYS